mmetsp:Transcript_31508/g.60095  ORF Transcript_31508/g.60095 Transcript_31508/m.60095 type:complete len:1368 (-) Transcript_31508:3769-7872(-)
MKLSIITMLCLRLLFLLVIAIVSAQPPDYYEEPLLILHSGQTVYHTPSSCGTITFSDPPPPDEAGSRPRRGSPHPHHELDMALPGFPQERADSTMGLDADAADISSNALDSSPIDDVEEFPLDITKLFDVTADQLEINFGNGHSVTFKRDLEYDAMHPHRTHHPEHDFVETHYGERARARKLRRPRHRRARDLCETMMEGDDDYDANAIEGCVNNVLDGDSKMDCLPSNPYFEPLDSAMCFRYFEGTSADPGLGYSAYIKNMTFPGGGEEHYLSGVINTPTYDYMIRGDMDTRRTMVRKEDPATYPNMPDPLEVPEDDEDEQPDSFFDEGSFFWDDGAYDADDTDAADGARADRRKLKTNLRINGNNKDGVGQKRVPNSFDEQIKRQVDNHLEKEKRRMNTQRRMQTDDGTVIDILIGYTKHAMCEAAGRSISNGGACDQIGDLDLLDPALHAPIINVAETSVVWTNTAYINSGIQTQLRLVHTYMTDFDDRGQTCRDMVYKWRDNNDNAMDEVHPKRTEYGADLAALLTTKAVSGCGGIAFVGPSNSYMFSVTLQRYSINAVFAHEVGHNFGCQHDRQNANSNEPYAYGWQDPAKGFRTIMAYNCAGRSCGRINYFSNPHKQYNNKAMGNAVNDCARKHNEGRVKISKYRAVRQTHSPTRSHVPSISQGPSEDPTGLPTPSPTESRTPSIAPSASSMPSDVPSEFPTFELADLATLNRIVSPGTAVFRVQHGIMFDITAKASDVRIRQFSLPFLRGGDFVVSIWMLESGRFWYEKNHKEVWKFMGSPAASSPGITLQHPMPLSPRGGTNWGFEPIVIPAGTTRGIYILINQTNTPPGKDNLIAIDHKANHNCTTDPNFVEPYDFQTWFEDENIAVSEGVYKESWDGARGTASDSARFLGSIWYDSISSTRRALVDDNTSLEVVSSPGSIRGSIWYDDRGRFESGNHRALQTDTTPSALPSDSSSPSMMPSISTQPSGSLSPSASSHPSIHPSSSLQPSSSSSPSEMPSTSSHPSIQPSSSLQPSESSSPSGSQHPSLAPSYNLKTLAFLSLELFTNPTLTIELSHGYMFEVVAKERDIFIHNLELLTKSFLFPGVEAEFSVWTSIPGDPAQPGQYYGATPEEGKWTPATPSLRVGTVEDATPVLLPASPALLHMVSAGTSMGIYVTFTDFRLSHFIGAIARTSTGTTDRIDLEDENMIIREGIIKQWNPCQSWGVTAVDTANNDRPHKLYGGLLYSLGSTASPVQSPSLSPSIMPSISILPSIPYLPSSYPTNLPSQEPSSSLVPSLDPTKSVAPSAELETLVTPVKGEGEGNNFYQTGSSADGVMFDLVAKNAIEIYSVTLGAMVNAYLGKFWTCVFFALLRNIF